MRFTTEVGYCAVEGHLITDAPGIDHQGYISPEVSVFDPYASGLDQKTAYRQQPRKRLCLAHYQEAWALRYPDEIIPFTEEADERDLKEQIRQAKAQVSRLDARLKKRIGAI